MKKSDLANRAKYVNCLIQKMNEMLSNESDENKKTMIKEEINGRIINIILRGYDIPLQGSTTLTCDHMKPIIPTPERVKKSGYFKQL